MTTYYVDNVSGDDANNGTESGTPKQTWQAIHALGLVGGSDDVQFVSDGSTPYIVPNSTAELTLLSGTHTVPYNASGEYVFPDSSIAVGGGGGSVDHFLNGLPRSSSGALVTVTGS